MEIQLRGRKCIKFAILLGLPLLCWSESFGQKTGYAFNPRCTTYLQSGLHPESPQRLKWIHNRLQETNVLQQLVPVDKLDDPMPHILKVHTQEHVQGIHSINRHPWATEKIGPIADLAAALALAAVREVCSGAIKNAFCNIRPPGHHVMNSGSTLGFCAYANVVIAARFAQEVMNHKRVLIIDWDCHHGNGTVHFVCKDTNVLFFEVGWEEAADQLCNQQRTHIIVKNAEGEMGNDKYISLWEQFLLPAADAFKPSLVLISCGFDIKKYDGLGVYNVTAHGISRLTRMAMDIAEKHCNGKLVSLLEGGYFDENMESETWYGLSQCAENHVKTLLTGIVQPETPFYQLTSVAAKPPAFGFRRFESHRHFPWQAYFNRGDRLFDVQGKSLIINR